MQGGLLKSNISNILNISLIFDDTKFQMKIERFRERCILIMLFFFLDRVKKI